MISEQGTRGIRPLDLWARSRDVTTIDLPATFIYRLRQVMSSSISPGLLDGNPPPRRGAPGEDLVDPAGVRKRGLEWRAWDEDKGSIVRTATTMIVTRLWSAPAVCRRHVDLLRVSSALCCS